MHTYKIFIRGKNDRNIMNTKKNNKNNLLVIKYTVEILLEKVQKKILITNVRVL